MGFNVKHITLIDGDIIENHNLNRQFLFTKNDIGRYKVEVIKEMLDKKNSNTKIKIKKSFLNEGIILKLEKGYVRPSSMNNNLLATAMASNEIINILGKKYNKLNSYNKRIGIYNIDLKLMEIEVNKNERCRLCSEIK